MPLLQYGSRELFIKRPVSGIRVDMIVPGPEGGEPPGHNWFTSITYSEQIEIFKGPAHNLQIHLYRRTIDIEVNSPMIRVFVSSTSKDLEDYRAVARHVVIDADWHPVMMEHFGSDTRTTVAACKAQLETCDLVVLLVAHRRGWVPTTEQGGDGTNSITALELHHARSKDIPVLVLMADETWPGNLWEDDADARQWIKEFREGLNQPAVFFKHEEPSVKESERLPAFRAKLREVLVEQQTRWLNRQPGVQHGPDFLNSAIEVLENSVPFLGYRVFADGPLDAESLASELAKGLDEDVVTLATAAEYRERYLKSRDRFLEQFRALLERRQQQVDVPDAYRMLLEHKPQLIVSATHDSVLDRLLAQSDDPPVVISHVLRSYDNLHDGKLIVLRPGQEAEICLADEVDIAPDERILYKPLGSPFLHDRLNEEDEIDTVVVTESDHLCFLGRLENQHSRVPSVVIRMLRRKALLFVGYPLNVWHFRLVMQVFQSMGAPRRRAPTLAVRRPRGLLEEVAWRRLGADIVPMAVQDFARRALSGEAS